MTSLIKPLVSSIIKIAQRDYYVRAIQDNRSDYKKIFFIANKLLYKNESLLLPLTENEKQMADNFNNFFVTKIDKIMSELVWTKTHPMDLKYIESNNETLMRLENFMEIDSEYKRTLIASAPVKLDSIPTTLLWNLDSAVPITAKIINLSLKDGEMPNVFKEALLRSLLKRSTLDLIFKHYCPVSNLSYISKLIKWAVYNNFMNYTKEMGNLEELQSTYREGHSMESALLKVKTDILNSMDKQKLICLILLNVGAAFDMVSHNLLLNCLWYRFRVQG